MRLSSHDPLPDTATVFASSLMDDSGHVSSGIAAAAGVVGEADSSRILGKKSYIESAAGDGASSGAGMGGAGSVGGKKKSRYVCVSETLLYLTLAAVVAVACTLIWYLAARSYEPHVYGWAIAGFFTCLAVAISMHDIHMHLTHYVSPLQRQYIRIIVMVVIYSTESWLALRFTHERTYFEICRDMYEAFVLYSFHLLMVQFLGGRRKLAERLRLSGKQYASHLPGCCCLRPWRMGSRFVHRTTLGVYQYVVLRVLTSIVVLITEATHTYGEGSWSPTTFYLYSTIIINVSQCWALYCLGLFYMNTRQWLKPLRPIVKFGLIKLLVFVFFWQSVAVAAAGTIGLIKPFWSYEDVAQASAALQDFVICIELFLASLAHHFFYSVDDFYSKDPTTVTPIMRMQQNEAAFDRMSAERQAEAGGRARTETDDGTLNGGGPAGGMSARSPTARHTSGGTGSAPPSSSSSSYTGMNRGAFSAPSDPMAFPQLTPQTARSSSALNSARQPSGSLSGGFGASAGPSPASAAASPMHVTPAASPEDAGSSYSLRSARSSMALGGAAAVAAPPSAAPLPPGELGTGDVFAVAQPTPLPVGAALYEMLPIDVVQDTAEQLRTGFGLLHKWQKRKEEEARIVDKIRNPDRAKKSKFSSANLTAAAAAEAATLGSAAHAGDALAGTGGAGASDSVAGVSNSGGDAHAAAPSTTAAADHLAGSAVSAVASSLPAPSRRSRALAAARAAEGVAASHPTPVPTASHMASESAASFVDNPFAEEP